MNNFRFLKFGYLTLVGCLFALPLAASANPSSLKLLFKYKSNGTLAIDVKFDAETDSRCIVRHRSALYFEGDTALTKGIIKKSTHSRIVQLGRKSTSLRATGLGGVVQKDGQDPIMSVQARLICSGSDDVTSNVEARFIRCGSSTKRISLSKYFSQLKKKLAKSS